MSRARIDGEMTSFKCDADLRAAMLEEFGKQGMAAYLRRIIREDLERRGRIEVSADPVGSASVPKLQAEDVGTSASAAHVTHTDLKSYPHGSRRDASDRRTKASWTSMRQSSRVIGQSIVSAWNDYKAFETDMGLRPPGAILVRKDQEQGWSPDNCKWGTKAEVVRNRSTYERHTIGDETKLLTEWAREKNLNPSTVQNRVKNRNWSIEEALKTPVAHVPVALPWKIPRRSEKNPAPIRKRDPRYKSWKEMRSRCKKRGDSYVPEWNEFWIFCRDMGERPERAVQLRHDASKPYGPGNSYWGTKADVRRIRSLAEKSRAASF